MSENENTPFVCNIEQFKQMAVKFLKRLDDPALIYDQLEQAFKALALHYIWCERPTKLEEIISVSTFEYCNRRYIDKFVTLH